MLVMPMLSADSSQLVVLSAHVTKDTQEMDSAAVVSLSLCCTFMNGAHYIRSNYAYET